MPDWIDKCAAAVIADVCLPAFLGEADVKDAAKIIRAHYIQHLLAGKPAKKQRRRNAVRKSAAVAGGGK